MSLNLSDTLTDISNSLAHLAFQVRSETAAGLTSRNRVAEDLLLPILRRAYAAPGLANTNVDKANFPGVDLFDPATGLGVQVTSDTDADKIDHTLTTIGAAGLPLKRLLVALVADCTPSYRAKTRNRWDASVAGRFAFASATDVFGFDRLLARIQQLPPAEIDEVAQELRLLVRGEAPVDLLAALGDRTTETLAAETHTGKYIPDLFVETRDTKYHARCFSHPRLFLRRIGEWLTRDPLAPLNRVAEMSGVAAVPTPAVPRNAAPPAVDTLEATADAAAALGRDLDLLTATLKQYERVGQPEGASLVRDPARDRVFREARYLIEMGAYGVGYRVAERRTEVRCIEARFFLLAGRAGQGKTNFVCDFVDRFFRVHRVPCAFLTARQLSRVPEPDLTKAVARLLFPPSIPSLNDGLMRLAAECAARGLPFVLVLDGLNEHPDLRHFSGQLEFLLGELARLPHVRVLMTCRSEFLDVRFGSLLNGPLEPLLHVSESHGHRYDDDEFDEMVERYFAFFGVRRDSVSDAAVAALRNDLLLLRFFCEAHGARGQAADYRQPRISNVYRDEIFRAYVGRKLRDADATTAVVRGNGRPPIGGSGLQRVLRLITAHMIENGVYADIPVTVIPPDLHDALFALLDEELLLRRDPGGPEASTSILAEPVEILNFTFDELRDYLLAQYLLELRAAEPAQFDARLAALQPTATQSLEGVQRFLFYAARLPTNAAFRTAYRAHPWYSAVYDEEVFNILPAYLDDEDRAIALSSLAGGGERVRQLTIRLSVRWLSDVYPVLNLALLLEYANEAPREFFDDVLRRAFGRASYDAEHTQLTVFCRFVKDKVLPKFAPASDAPSPDGDEERLFRLLIMLLPVDSNTWLDSPAAEPLRALAGSHPQYAFGLLRDALGRRDAWNRAHVWRLLSELAPTLPDAAALREYAVADAGVRSDGEARLDAAVEREAAWFLTRLDATDQIPGLITLAHGSLPELEIQ